MVRAWLHGPGPSVPGPSVPGPDDPGPDDPGPDDQIQDQIQDPDDHSQGTPHDTTPGTPPLPHLLLPWCTPRTGVWTCAMGSKRGVRTAGRELEVNLRPTIWALATLLVPGCKNHLVSRPQGAYIYPIHLRFY